jgi:uncharacterized protein YqjF (DUF2071 family)
VRTEPVTAAPPRPVRLALLTQAWREVAFLHWPIDPLVAAPLLPPGTRPDLFRGRTYVGLVLLRIAGTRLPGGAPVPWLGSFGQVNVRLCSVDRGGRRGVVFLALDAGRLPPALAARELGRLPYAWSRVHLDSAGELRTYTAQRRWPGSGRARVVLRVGPRREPGRLDLFLTARWGLHHALAGRTVYGGVEHAPWPLHAAELLECDTDLLARVGLPADPGPPASVLWSPGLEARLGVPGSLRRAREPCGPGRGPRG